MKKTLKLCSLLLATVMLASLCACSAQEESHPSDEMMPLAPTQVSDPIVSATEEMASEYADRPIITRALSYRR